VKERPPSSSKKVTIKSEQEEERESMPVKHFEEPEMISIPLHESVESLPSMEEKPTIPSQPQSVTAKTQLTQEAPPLPSFVHESQEGPRIVNLRTTNKNDDKDRISPIRQPTP
jgi:hypothetical protein